MPVCRRDVRGHEVLLAITASEAALFTCGTPPRYPPFVMTSWKPQTRADAAYHRRIEREALKRQRELEKLAKERAKLNAIEQARLEVAEFENRIEVLLSVHKDCAESTDWLAAGTELPPPPPARGSYY